MPFKQYPKIHRLGAEENDSILIGEKVYITEKIDGANTQIWVREDGTLGMGSRTQDVTHGEFNGFTKYVREHLGINSLLKDNPLWRLYGEWLVRHSLQYNETAYKQWYLFDIEVSEDERLSIEKVVEVAKQYGIKHAELFCVLSNPSVEDISKFVGKSVLGPDGEGVVIKNFDFVNKFGSLEYAKVVTQKFKEENALTFGGNNKHSETYWEQWCVNKYVTLERVQKIMNKIQPLVEHRLGVEDTSRIIHTVYHDYITEEIWEIQKKVPELNFKSLSQLSTRKAAKVYHDILNDTLSVAYQKHEVV